MEEEQNKSIYDKEEEISEEETEVNDNKTKIDPNALCVLQDVHERIFSRNQNFLGLIVGQTGSGKSYAGLSIAEMLDPEFDVSRVIFDLDKLLEYISQSPPLPKGSVILIDEFGVVMGNRDWQSEQNKNLSKILQTVRYKNYYFIFTVPSMSFIDTSARKLIHYVFKTQKIVKRDRECVLRPYKIELDSLDTKGEPYKRFMHISVNGHHRKIKSMRIKLPSVKLRHAYEKKKDEVLSDLYNKMKKPEPVVNNDPEGLNIVDRKIADLIRAGKKIREVAEACNIGTASVSVHLGKMRKNGIDI